MPRRIFFVILPWVLVVALQLTELPKDARLTAAVWLLAGLISLGLLVTWGPLYSQLQRSRVKWPMLSTGIAAITGAVIFGIVWWFFFQRSSGLSPPVLDEKPTLEFSAYIQPSDSPYPDGLIIGGIPWKMQYVDVRLDISIGPRDIQNLDLLIGLDTSIANVGQISQFPGITAFPATEMPPVWLEGANEKGDSIAIPVTPSPGMARIYTVYRVRGSSLFSNTALRLVIASVSLNPPTAAGGIPQQLFAPRRAPRTIKIEGSFQTSEVDGLHNWPVDFMHTFTLP